MKAERLITAAQKYRGGICLPAVAVMLYVGARPREVARLTWEQVYLHEGVISILPEHRKTGGAHQVTIQPVLRAVLRRAKHTLNVTQPRRLCPPNRKRHWTQLHRVAGWTSEQGSPWQPDVPRHTFATNSNPAHLSLSVKFT